MASEVTCDRKFEICGLKNLRLHVSLASKGLHMLDERQEAQTLFLVIVLLQLYGFRGCQWPLRSLLTSSMKVLASRIYVLMSL